MPATRDYRKQVTRSILTVFFGLLAALIAPDLGIGLRKFVAVAGALVVAAGALRMWTLPVRGLYRPFMFASGVLSAAYAVGFSVLVFSPGEAVPLWLSGIVKFVGAAALFLLAAAMEIICRRLKWTRLARGWFFTQALVGFVYALPSLFGLFSRFYAPILESWRLFGLLMYELSAFEFHGMRLPGVKGHAQWPLFLLFALVLPAAAILVNLLRTYVQAATPPSVDDSKPIQWSRR